jgi:hypothetical protein
MPVFDSIVHFDSKKMHVNLVLTPDAIGLYRWFLLREYAWISQSGVTIGLRDNDLPNQTREKKPPRPFNSLMKPAYEAHVTVVSHRHDKPSKASYERLRKKYNGLSMSVEVDTRMQVSFSKRRGGFMTFALKVRSPQAEKIRRDFGLKRSWLHMTVANTKSS